MSRTNYDETMSDTSILSSLRISLYTLVSSMIMDVFACIGSFQKQFHLHIFDEEVIGSEGLRLFCFKSHHEYI